MKNRVVAAIIAFVFGAFGAHKFYLRDPGAGIFYLILFFVTSRFFPVTAILGIIDAFRLLMMSDEDFDRRYNKRIVRRQRYRDRRNPDYRRREPVETTRRKQEKVSRPTLRKRSNPFKKSGIKKYKEFDLEDAIEDFKKGLEIEPQDIALHFNIACAYSLTEQKEKAYDHLAKAVEYGFKDTEKILTHDDLAYVRIQPEFDDFKKSGFKIGKKVDDKGDEQFAEEELTDDVLLSQLNKLAELRKKGLLSEEEFALERKKLLNR
ncbi:MAG: NINE protein [Melioribacteraceae bacterium]|nr:NINE protein [Melioribacteraceae bacterium]